MPENRYSREVCNDNHYEEQTTMVLVTPSQCQAGMPMLSAHRSFTAVCERRCAVHYLRIWPDDMIAAGVKALVHNEQTGAIRSHPS